MCPTLGMRIYYTGDMANQSGQGTIVAHNPPDKFARAGTFDVDMDDGRKWRGLFPSAFDASPGRRFWPLDEWLEDRRARLAEMAARLKAQGLA